MPGYEDFWASLGFMPNAGLTNAGELQLQAVGRMLRNKYVDVEGYLPSTYDASTQSYALYVRASAQGHYGYVLRSAEAALSTLYPGASVPVYSKPDAIDEELFRAGNCDSFSMQGERLLREFDDAWATQFPQFFADLAVATGFLGLTPTQLISLAYDNLVKLATHAGPMPQFFIDNRDLITEFEFEKYYAEIRTEENDPRGVNGFEISRRFLVDLEGHLDGTNPFAMDIYVTHGNALNVLFEAWGLEFNRVRRGDAFVLEVRELDDGSRFVNGRYYSRIEESDNSSYQERIKALNCPLETTEPCPLDDFLDYAWARTGREYPQPPGTGCCLRTQAFFDYGCDDFLNPASALIQECHDYRYHCPASACGPGQILDQVTMTCVNVA